MIEYFLHFKKPTFRFALIYFMLGLQFSGYLMAQSCQTFTTGLGELWYNVQSNSQIRKVDPVTGVQTTYNLSGQGFDAGQSLTDIGFAPNGKLYVVTFNANKNLKWAAGGNVTGAGGSMYEVTLVGNNYTVAKVSDFGSTFYPNALS